MRTILALLVFFGLSIGAAWAVDPDEVLDDPVLEERAREISKGLRCVVCKNQSIDESDASLAKDLRILVRSRLEEGDTDEEVVNYVVDRYGEFVLLRPRFSAGNLFLWFAPLFVLLGGAVLAIQFLRSQKPEPVQQSPLDPEEQSRLAELFGDGDASNKE